MSEYLTEEEQVEALKKWWRENGKAIIVGAVLGLSLVGGWQAWQNYQKGQAELASAYYEEFMLAAKAGDDSAQAQGERLLQRHGDSTYAQFAALELAALAYRRGDRDEARSQLSWVLDRADEPAIAQLARLRLARVLIDSKDFDGATRLIEAAGDDSYAGEFAALRGDLAMAQGEREKARAAYQEALLKGAGDAEIIRMKLVDLKDAGAS